MVSIELISPETVTLSHDEVRRFSRHLIMPEVGLAGQKKLNKPASCSLGRAGWAARRPYT
jgi:hypothetical protein